MHKKVSLLVSGALALLIFLSWGQLAWAEVSAPLIFEPEVSIPGSDFSANAQKQVGENASLICDYIIAVYKYAIAIIGVLAVVAIALGGAMWVLSAGNQTRIADGKSWITGGLLGLVLALGSFVILATISKDLVTCKITSIAKIAPQELPGKGPIRGKSFGENFGTQGQKNKQPAERLDDSGKFYCCVIYGDVDESSAIYDVSLKKCATFESAEKQPALERCRQFYQEFEYKGNEINTGVTVKKTLESGFVSLIPIVGISLAVYRNIGILWDFGKEVLGEGQAGPRLEDYDNLQEPKNPSNPNDQEKNSAEVYEGQCWNIPAVKEFCMGSDDPDFCKIRGDYKACLTSQGNWGYCSGGACQICKKHCQACTEDQECPNQTKNPDFDGVSAVVCGEEIYKAWGVNSNDCSSGKCDRQYKIDSNGNGRLDDDDNEVAPCP